MTNAGGRWRIPALLALVCLLPGLRAALPGLTYYLRDFSLTFYPQRAFFVAELRHLRWPFWNPYLYEGTAPLPAFYPADLLQALWPGPAAMSWLLTLHLPLAALGAYALARELGADRWGAFTAGALFGMGGFTLSCLNLYCFLQALALAPFVALTMARAAERGGREVVWAALVLALSISTLVTEFVWQGLGLGFLIALAARPAPRTAGRLAAATALSVGLASLPIALVVGLVRETVRGAGIPPSLALRSPLNPLTLGQLVLPHFLGEPGDSLRVWWAGRLFPDGSPYFLSLYLGPLAVALAITGLVGARERRQWAVALAALVAFWFALGERAGLAPAVLSIASVFRFPAKGFLLVHLALCLFAGLGATRLRANRGWGALAVIGAFLAIPIVATWAIVVRLQAPLVAWLDISPGSALALSDLVPRDARLALLLLATGLFLALAVRAGRLAPRTAAACLVALVAADVGWAGTGFNRQASSDLYTGTPGLAAAAIDPDGGRAFTLGVNASPAVAALLRQKAPDVELAAFRLSREVLNPFLNVLDRVEMAEGVDRHSFTPSPPALEAWEYAPSHIGRVLDRLRNAAVTRVVSLDPLEDPDLTLRASLPTQVPGFAVHVYDVARPWPRAYVACRVVASGTRSAAATAPFASGFDPARDVALESGATGGCGVATARRTAASSDSESFDVWLDGPGVLVSRASYTPSWHALVDGVPAPVLRANGRHRAVPLAAGRHTVVLRYDPPGLRAGLAGTIVSLLATALLLRRPGAGLA